MNNNMEEEERTKKLKAGKEKVNWSIRWLFIWKKTQIFKLLNRAFPAETANKPGDMCLG